MVGFSGYGSFYADFLLGNPYDMRYAFKAVVDTFLSPDSKALLDEKGIPYFENLTDFYRDNTCDLVIISSPMQFHKNQCEIAVKNGSVVLCEKPTTARLSDLYEMHEYEKEYDKDIFIGFQWSFARPILALKNDIIAGKFGKVLSAKALVLWPRNLDYYSRSTGWAGKVKTADGLYVYDSVASNATAHYLNNMLFLFGERMDKSVGIEKIDAECFKANDIESFDTCIIRAKTVGGQKVLFIASHATDKSREPILEIKCEKAVISCDFSKDSGRLTAEFENGDVKDYGQVSTMREQHEKIVSVINWLSDSEKNQKPVSTVMTTEAFTKIIDYVFENTEFAKFDDVKLDSEKNCLHVDGLFEKLCTVYDNEAKNNPRQN